jgi:transposase
MQRTRRRPREPGGGPAAGAVDLGRYAGGSHPLTPRIHEAEGRDAGGTAATAFVGIDVSKATPDAGLLGPEATGPSEYGPATALAEAGRLVSVANPARVKAHAAAGGQGNKTDAADARAIAESARDRRPPAWRPPAPGVRELQGLVRRRDDLRETAARDKARLDSPALTRAARRSIERAVKFLAREADRRQAEADALIAARPALKADRDLLASIPGVGPQTAATVLAELPAIDRLPSAQSAAASAGLAPREFRSGSSVRRRARLSKAGNPRLRQALFLPTQTAVRFNPLLKGFFDRLVAAGKPKMRAVGACLRKLVMLCYGVLKNRQPFDPNWASKKAP